MLSLFKTIPVYIILYKNKVNIYRLDSGNSIEREAKIPFSNSRILWADFHRGEEFIKTILKDLIIDVKTICKPSFCMIIHQVELTEGGISNVEKRALVDSARHMYANEVHLIEDENELSIKDASERLIRLKKENKRLLSQKNIHKK